MVNLSFNKKIQELRKSKGLSQEKLSEIVGVSRQSIAKWELGQSYPEIDNIILISDLFGISIDDLLKNHNEECKFSGLQKDIRELDNLEIIEFLCRAKINTYAGSKNKVKSSRPNSNDLMYKEGNLKYIDSYLGSDKFIGEEGIWINEEPYWGMNYYGRVIGEGFSGSFLKEALRLVEVTRPFRGPIVYQKGDYTYHCIVEGEFKWFKGQEEIYFKDKKIYECIFHGGVV